MHCLQQFLSGSGVSFFSCLVKIRYILGYTKGTNQAKFQFFELCTFHHPDALVCHFSPAHNTTNLELKFKRFVDLINIYMWDLFHDFLKRKNANFNFNKKRAIWNSGSKTPHSPTGVPLIEKNSAHHCPNLNATEQDTPFIHCR